MPEYTIEDMRTLADMSAEGSVPRIFLPRLNYDPSKYRKFLEERGLKRDIEYLFEYPESKLPMLINQKNVSGYVLFRFSIGK